MAEEKDNVIEEVTDTNETTEQTKEEVVEQKVDESKFT